MVGYYPKLGQLVSGLMHHDILTGSAKSFADLNAQVEQLSKRCSEAFGSYGRLKPPGVLSLRQHLPQAPVRRLPVLMHGTRHARLSGAKDLLHVTRCVRCKVFYPRLTACLTFCARCLLHAMTTSGAIKARCTGFISSHLLFSVVYGSALSV